MEKRIERERRIEMNEGYNFCNQIYLKKRSSLRRVKKRSEKGVKKERIRR